MKQTLLTTLAFVVGILALSADDANRLYVMVGGEGDGSSWEAPLGDLQAALITAEAGDQVWVANGVYAPTQDGDRTASFTIPNGVMVYGGFVGTEQQLNERNAEMGTTVLTGEIGDAEDLKDNTQTIVHFVQVDNSTVLDGFTLTASYSNGMVEGVDLSTCGGAIFNDGSNGVSSPTITNCSFVDNFSREGAAIYNYSDSGETAPIITNCYFEANRADFNGGAVFNNGSFGICKPIITNCAFKGNESMYGAGILNRGLYGECQPQIQNCAFIDNFSVVRGGALYNQREGRGICEAVLEGCVFEDNGSTVGDGDIDGTVKVRSGYQDGSDDRITPAREEAISY